ncbi:hypothetical protein OS493_036264 [Desmophyllum pertusum]|uniref:Uncharacterized protein n=1 Tax=Desmophyllum pertusum TaxID=174260 RepID=A0A9W9ZI86_9CNID|nr:hypothetical protein OS493_036264 [Desmophyllum pertusum]
MRYFKVYVQGSAALYCNYCYSNKSWEECESKSEQHYCKDNIPYVCYTSHIVERRMERKSILIRRVAEERIFALGRSASTTGAMYIAAIQTLVITSRCF